MENRARQPLRYTPSDPPQTGLMQGRQEGGWAYSFLRDFISWLNRELVRIQHSTPSVSILERLAVEPAKPIDGMVVFADGSNWDPGSGRGIYYYDEDTTSWVKL